MKFLLIAMMILGSFSAFSRECTLFIGELNRNSGTESHILLQEAQKIMTSKGYLLVFEKAEAKYSLEGYFTAIKYENDKPFPLDSNRFNVVLTDNDYPYTSSTHASSMYLTKLADIRSLRKALKKLGSCH